MQKIFLKISAGIILFLSFIKTAWAETLDQGLDATAALSNLKTGNTDLVARIGAVISVALGLVGILFFGVILYAGFLWMTAGGDKNAHTKSITMIRNGAVGLILIMGAYVLTNFVVGAIVPNSPSAGSASQIPQCNTAGVRAVCTKPGGIRCAPPTLNCTCTCSP